MNKPTIRIYYRTIRYGLYKKPQHWDYNTIIDLNKNGQDNLSRFIQILIK